MLLGDVGREHRRHRFHHFAVGLVRYRLCGPGLLALTVGLGRHRHLRNRVHRFAGLAVQDVEPAVLVRLGKRLDRLAVHLHVEQDRLLAVVVVPDVVVHLLVVPLHLSVLERQRHDRVGEQVRTRALGAVAKRVADRDVEQAQLGIDRRRLPDAAAVSAAADPGRTGDVPPLVVLVLRNGVEVPEHLAGLGVDRHHVTARNHALAAGRAHIQDALVDLRRAGEPVAHRDRGLGLRKSKTEDVQDDAGLAVVSKVPDRLAGLGVEREHEGAGGAVDDPVGVGDAAMPEDVALLATAAEQLRHVIDPQQVAVLGVHGVDAAPGIGDVHDAIHDDRRRLVADAIDDAVLEEPAWGQQMRILRGDLVGLGEPAAG